MKTIENSSKVGDDIQINTMLNFIKKIIKSCVYEAITEHEKDRLKNTALNNSSDDGWLSSEAAKKLLGIKSKSKLQQLRDNGEILFSQHGRIIKYSKKSILDFLNRNVVNIHLTPIKKIRV